MKTQKAANDFRAKRRRVISSELCLMSHVSACVCVSVGTAGKRASSVNVTYVRIIYKIKI